MATLIEYVIWEMRNNQNREKDKSEIRKKHLAFPYSEIYKIYDIGIQACNAKDTTKACNVAYTLKGLIGDQCVGVASGVHRLFDHCLQFVNDEKFEKARIILYELRQSWNVEVMTNLKLYPK